MTIEDAIGAASVRPTRGIIDIKACIYESTVADRTIRKHEARHEKSFKCDEPNCNRKEGFGTINDLERHKKCVHKKEPGRGPKKMYICFGKNCPRRNKMWPRLDNFRQHINRMHEREDVDELLNRQVVPSVASGSVADAG